MSPAEKVIKAFQDRLTKLLDYHSELMLAVHRKQRQAVLETMLVEQLIMSLGVLWEAFLTDLFIAYITMNPSTFLEGLATRIDSSVRDRFGPTVARAVQFRRPTTLSSDKASLMLDPKGWNIAVSSAEILKQRANQMLTAPHAIKFSLPADDGQFVDLFIALRNYLAHQSAGSRRTLKEAIQNLSGNSNLPLKGNFNHIGTYLKHKDANGFMRARIIADRLSNLAGNL